MPLLFIPSSWSQQHHSGRVYYLHNVMLNVVVEHNFGSEFSHVLMHQKKAIFMWGMTMIFIRNCQMHFLWQYRLFVFCFKIKLYLGYGSTQSSLTWALSMISPIHWNWKKYLEFYFIFCYERNNKFINSICMHVCSFQNAISCEIVLQNKKEISHWKWQ